MLYLTPRFLSQTCVGWWVKNYISMLQLDPINVPYGAYL